MFTPRLSLALLLVGLEEGLLGRRNGAHQARPESPGGPSEP